MKLSVVSMDRKMLERDLEQSERHSAVGWRVIARQTDVLVGLVVEGADKGSVLKEPGAPDVAAH